MAFQITTVAGVLTEVETAIANGYKIAGVTKDGPYTTYTMVQYPQDVLESYPVMATK